MPISDTPAAVRHLLLSHMASEIRDLRDNPAFASFFSTLCRTRANDLWSIVKPMMHQKTSQDWDDLLYLVVEAHNVAGAMFTGPYEWKIDFPNVNDLFQPSRMINQDPFIRGINPQELEVRGVVVRLGVSPFVSFRSSSNKMEMETTNVHMANVLIKWQ